MGNFSLLKDAGVRMAVLEEKLTVYEELSKEMLTKLESAVDKISEANQNISKILVRHEERLDQTIQSDAAIIKLLDEMKKQNQERFSEINTTLNDHEKRISEIARFRWMVAGALIIIGFIVGEIRPIRGILGLGEIQQAPPQQLTPRQ
jgi:CHASE3 domain sensor protein